MRHEDLECYKINRAFKSPEVCVLRGLGAFAFIRIILRAAFIGYSSISPICAYFLHNPLDFNEKVLYNKFIRDFAEE